MMKRPSQETPRRAARRGLRRWCVFLAWGLAPFAVGCNAVAQNQNAAGVAQFQAGRFAEAQAKFLEAAGSNPSNADAYYNLAAVHHRMGKLSNSPNDLRQAETYYQMALARNARHAPSYRGLSVLLADQGRGPEAFQLLTQWSNSDFRSVAPRMELARLSEEFRRVDLAEQHLQTALMLQPSYAPALNALGRIRETSGQYELAAMSYSQSLNANPSQPMVSQRLGQIQTRLASSAGGVAPQTRPLR